MKSNSYQINGGFEADDTTTGNGSIDLNGITHTNGDIKSPTSELENGTVVPEAAVEVGVEKQSPLYYKITETPPIHLVIVFAFQQCLLTVSGTLTVSLLVAELVCAKDDEWIKSQILSSTMFMAGITTFCMTTFGVRLPIFQGPAKVYIIPLLALTTHEDWLCPAQNELATMYANRSENYTLNGRGEIPVPHSIIYSKIGMLMGSLMVSSVIHFLIGFTGLVGFVLRFVGPITVIPCITLVGLFIYRVTVKFSETHWGVACLTAGLAILFSLYLRKLKDPLPACTPKRGCFITWFPVHQMFAVLIAIIIGWSVSAILTVTNVIDDDPKSIQYYARTDSRSFVIDQSGWFYFPYPGQFGMPTFNTAALVAFLIATVLSVIDSIGDYSACARMCYVPPPPKHAVNRGIAVEGFLSIISGSMGIGHGTASQGNNIGAIGLTRVASRRVLQAAGLIFVVFAVIQKIGAFCVTIPYSVIGGAQIVGIGIYLGIALSNLHYVDLSSTRNLAIIGIALLMGLMMPYWVEKRPDAINTGSKDVDRILSSLLANPTFVGGVLACFLDNTVPGTKRERGLHIWQEEYDGVEEEGGSGMFEEGREVYQPLFIPERLKRSKWARFIPIIPDYKNETQKA